MQNSKKDAHQQTEVNKGDHSVGQSQDDKERKDKKNNDQQPNARHQDASKDQAMKNTSSEDKSGAKMPSMTSTGKVKMKNDGLPR